MLLDSAYLQLLTPAQKRALILSLPELTLEQLEKIQEADIGRVSVLAMIQIVRKNLKQKKD